MKKPKKKINYNPTRMVKALATRQVNLAAKEPEVLLRMEHKKIAVRLHLKGRTHDQIAQTLGISTIEAHELIRERIQEWIKSESFDPAEMRELTARRYDGALAIALQQATPHPLVDEFGRPDIGNVCACKLERGELCSIEGHTAQKLSQPSMSWLKVYLEVLGEQKKMFGLDAAEKIQQEKVDTLKRMYLGVGAEVIDKL